MSRHVIVVGGGITGLATAFWLTRERPGVAVTVLEAGETGGGIVTSTDIDGFTVERGPSSLRPGALDTTELIEALGLTAEIVPAAASAGRRYLVRRGKLMPLPNSPRSALETPLLSLAGKLRVLAEPFVQRGEQTEESVDGFLRRRFGEEVAERLAEPLVSGLVAGDPERLSVAALFPQLVALEGRYGSVLRGLLANKPAAARQGGPYTFRGGMGRLSRALASALGPTLRTGAVVSSLRRSGDGYELRLADGTRLGTKNVVLATPAHVSAGLLQELAPSAAAELSGIASAGVGVATLAYRRASLPALPGGFGFLAPRGQGVRSLGVQFMFATFPLQAPKGAVSLRAIAGGVTDPGFLDLEQGEALATVRRDLATTLGISAEPILAHYDRLPAAIPQYEVGQQARVARIDRELTAMPGLHLVGHATRGVGVNACLRAARTLSQALSRALDAGEKPLLEAARGVERAPAGTSASN